MNKKNLIKTAANHAGLTVKDEQKAVDAFLAVISNSLKEGKDVVIPDFGRFSLVEFRERQVRHPQTGEKITVPATKRVRFKPFGNITHYAFKYGI